MKIEVIINLEDTTTKKDMEEIGLTKLAMENSAKLLFQAQINKYFSDNVTSTISATATFDEEEQTND